MDNMDVQALGETDTGSTSTPAHEPHTMRKRSERSRSRMRAIAPSAECRDTSLARTHASLVSIWLERLLYGMNTSVPAAMNTLARTFTVPSKGEGQ